jgi:beta-lactam-binding protein with PASTA domain
MALFWLPLFVCIVYSSDKGTPKTQTLYYALNYPDVMGMHGTDAEVLLTKEGFTNIKVVEIQANNSTQIGIVLKQDPSPGQHIYLLEVSSPADEKAINAHVKAKLLTVSVGSHRGFVPHTLLRPESLAVEAVKKARFIPKIVYYPSTVQAEAGTVLASDPPPYSKLTPGGTVLLRVAKPAYETPNFIGNVAEGAKQIIDYTNNNQHLSLKWSLVQDKNTNVRQDDQKIYRQKPAPGTIITEGAEIRLFAFKYVPPPAKLMPVNAMSSMINLIGKTEQEAVNWLDKANLKTTVKYASSPQSDWGRVIAQSVPAGSRTAGPVVITVGQK